MKKLLKTIPLIAAWLVAAVAAAGCAGTANEESTATAVTTASALSAVVTTYSSTIDGTCDHSYAATQVIAASCTNQGYTVYTCSNCGDSYKDNYIAANGHSYQEIIVSATCTHKGYTHISVQPVVMSISIRSWTKRDTVIRT